MAVSENEESRLVTNGGSLEEEVEVNGFKPVDSHSLPSADDQEQQTKGNHLSVTHQSNDALNNADQRFNVSSVQKATPAKVELNGVHGGLLPAHQHRSNGLELHENGDGFKRDMNELVDLLSKLNPRAQEFVPGSNALFPNNFVVQNSNGGNANYRRVQFDQKKNNFNQGKRRMNSRTTMAQREEVIRRTVYVSDIDQQVTEEQLAALFSHCGHVVDCRVCGDPNSVLRFAFIEFFDEEGAKAAISLRGTVLGYYPVKVLPSKTAIAPVNPSFLPRTEDEREMCARTVYCTNIDKKVSQAEVKLFFETLCGEVYRLRLLGDYHHSTRIAFVEFVQFMPTFLIRASYVRIEFATNNGKQDVLVVAHNFKNAYQAESAISALNCSGAVLGTLPIRVSPSKTPVRPRAPRPPMH